MLLEEVAPYRYCFTKGGIMENEICPILVGVVEHEPAINPDEVQAVRWREWNAFLEEIVRDPTTYSEWCVEGALILEKTPQFRKLIGHWRFDQQGLRGSTEARAGGTR